MFVKRRQFLLPALFVFAVIGSAFGETLVDWGKNEICSQEFINQKLENYPELHWLLDDKVELTQEGHNISTPTSWSLRLGRNNKHYGEFERSILSLVILDLILSGTPDAYQKVIKIQKSDQLSKKSFDELHHLGQQVLQNKEHMRETLETALVLGDMGKTPHAHSLAPDIKQADHDLFLEQVLHKDSQIFPSFNRLDKKSQALIKQVTGLVHFGHVTHVEGTPKKMLEKIKNSGVFNDPHDPYRFELLVHICDVAANGGQTNNQGSTMLIEKTYQTLMAVKDALYSLKSQSEVDALKQYMQIRGKWMGIDLVEYPILVRIGCMLRFYSPEEGKALVAAWNSLPSEQKQFLLEEFHPFKEYPGNTPTYVPAMLLNVWNSKQGTAKERMDLIFTVVLPTVVQYIKTHGRSGMTLNFNSVAGYLRDHVGDLTPTNFQLALDKTGRVSVLESAS